VNSSNQRPAPTKFSFFRVRTVIVALAGCLLLAGCSLGGRSRLAKTDPDPEPQAEATSRITDLADAPQMRADRSADSTGSAVRPVSFDRPADGAFAAASPAGGRVAHATSHDFDQLVLQSEVPVLVDFYADWCGPCKRLAPSLDELAQEMPNARIVKVNVEENPGLARRYQVGPIPALRVFRNGEVTASHKGFASKDKLRSLLTSP
jgi:thioredoxin 1